MNNPVIAVVIASHNRSEYFKRSLECYALQPYKNFYLIACDDDSTDDFPSVCKEYGRSLGLEIVYMWFMRKRAYTPRNGAQLHNWGIRGARGDIIVTTSPEIMVGPTTLIELASVVENPDDIRFFNGKPYILSRKHQEKIDTVDWRRKGACVAVRELPDFYDKESHEHKRNTEYQMRNIEQHKSMETDMFCAMTRNGWKKVGGHPPAKAWGEDDLSFLSERARLGIKTHTLQGFNSIVVHQNHDGPNDVKNPRGGGRVIPGPWNNIYW